MTEQTQILLSMFGLLWVTMFAGFGWGIRLLMDMNTRLGEIKLDMDVKLGEIKGDIGEIKAEIRSIHKRLDSLESGVVTKR